MCVWCWPLALGYLPWLTVDMVYWYIWGAWGEDKETLKWQRWNKSLLTETKEGERDSNLDWVPLDVDGWDVGQVVSRWVAVDGSSSWLSWTGQNHRGAGGVRSRRGGGRRRLLSQHKRKKHCQRGEVSFTNTTWQVSHRPVYRLYNRHVIEVFGSHQVKF